MRASLGREMPVKPLLFPTPRHVEWGQDSVPAEARVDEAREVSLPTQGFTLRCGAGGVELRYADAAGHRYAKDCLAQLRAGDGSLPAVFVRDAPDFPVRAYMLDVSRNRVPTRATLIRIVELLALCRINQLQLYTEHTFAYRAHEGVWREASPLTPDDVRWLDALCAEHGVELVANQNCFGHMAPWLRHEPYRARAECPDGWDSPLGLRLPPATLAPTPDNAEFALGLLRELLDCFTSRRVNIGCDETFELGQGVSREAVARRGRGPVFFEHLQRLLGPLRAEGHEVLFWADMLRGEPELLDSLPADGLGALVWHYEAPLAAEELPESVRGLLAGFGMGAEVLRGFSAQVGSFADSGVPFWVCPGTSTWNSLLGRWQNARTNLLDAAETGLAQGARGFLIADWGDNGHLQPPSVSFPAIVYGAGLAWSMQGNRSLPVAEVLDAFVFRDAAGLLGNCLLELGDVYAGTGRAGFNGSPLFGALLGRGVAGSWGSVDAEATQAVVGRLEAVLSTLPAARPGCGDGDQVSDELATAIRLARQGAWRLLAEAGASAPRGATLARDLQETLDAQRQCWLARARPGGLEASLEPLREIAESPAG